MASIAGHVRWHLEHNLHVAESLAMDILKRAADGDPTAQLTVVLCSLMGPKESPLELDDDCSLCGGTMQIVGGAVCPECAD